MAPGVLRHASTLGLSACARRGRKAGHACNIKKIHRLWREEGLRVPQKRRKRSRLGETSIPAGRRTALLPDHVWSLDLQFDVTAAGRTIRLLNIIDEFTRESLAIVIDRSMRTRP